MLYNVVLVANVEQSESAIHIHISPLFFFFGFSSHLGHNRALSRVPIQLSFSCSVVSYFL